MDRLTAIRDWVIGQVGAVREITTLRAGLGDTDLWRVHRDGDQGDLLVRLFRPGAEANAQREVLAMHAAHAGGVPVPEVVVQGMVDDRPVMLTAWCDGAPAMEILAMADMEQTRAIGLAMGRVQGRINTIPAPTGLRTNWLERGGEALAPLTDRLRALPNADRLLHLDYHPLNVLLTPDGEVAGVIDWANAMAGPPYLDLARSLAIVRSVVVGMAESPIPAERMTAFCDGLVAGHTEVAGPDRSPALSAGWAAAWTYGDLANHIGKPGSWVTPEVLERLRADRDAVMTTAVSGR